jgi:hypothetical protein
VNVPPREVELNVERRRQEAREFRQHLITASNELFLHARRCVEAGRPLPESLRRAHATVRAEIRRLEAEEQATRREADRASGVTL